MAPYQGATCTGFQNTFNGPRPSAGDGGGEGVFEAALDLAPNEFGTTPDADDVASLRPEADACYQAAMAELAKLGHGRPAAKRQQKTTHHCRFVLLPTSKTVN